MSISRKDQRSEKQEEKQSTFYLSDFPTYLTMTSPFIIGIDIGTSGTKAIAFTPEGKILGNAYVSYDPLPVAHGHHELDPDLLFKATLDTLRDTVQQTRAMGQLAGVSFSSAMHSVIAVDNEGLPLTQMITWADLRSASYASAMKGSEKGKRIYKHTGTPIHPMSPLCKIMWMREHEPAIFNKTHKFIGIKEYIFYKLFGQYLIDHSIASGTGLFDIYTRTWYAEALTTAGITADHLSQPVSTTHIVSGLSTTYAVACGIDETTPFITGASDGCLANLGSNAIHPGDVSITIGTSGAVRMMADKPSYDEKERIFNYILTGQQFVCGGPVNNALSLVKWYAENFLQRPITNGQDIEWFVAEAAKAPAGAAGLIFLPYIQGERAPVWDGRAKGVFLGVHSGHTQAHFMRAIIEGINYALYQVAASVTETVQPAQHIYASGGFLHAPLWIQWLTNLFGKEIIISNTGDASAAGAALLGFQSLSTAASFSSEQEQIIPQPNEHRQYMKYYPIYASLYEKLKDDFLQLDSL
jgi:gluconokinase